MFLLRINITLALVALTLVACGSSDNSTTSQNGDDGSVQLYGAKVATTASTLPTCDSTQVGQLFYVLADQEFQFCSSDGYQSIDLSGIAGTDGVDGKDGATGTNGTSGADGSSCSVISNTSGSKTILCEDGTTATVNDGASCTVVDNSDGSYDLTCSGTTVTVRDGTNGTDGTSCTVADNGAGTLTQTCTDGTTASWPKALCGGVAYEPTEYACAVSHLYPFHSYTTAEITAIANLPNYCENTGNCGVFEDTRDNREYRWTKIGTQTWMAENLAYLPSVNKKSESSPSEARYYVYDYDANVVADAKARSHYTTYGVLYNWTAAMAGATSSKVNPSGVTGVCPTGWHMPSSAEWTTLETYVGGASTAGTKLKSVSGWTAGGDTETDAYGFSALPGGIYYGSGFSNALNYGYWWTATEGVATNADGRRMGYDDADVLSDVYDKNYGFSVRCVQD